MRKPSTSSPAAATCGAGLLLRRVITSRMITIALTAATCCLSGPCGDIDCAEESTISHPLSRVGGGIRPWSERMGSTARCSCGTGQGRGESQVLPQGRDVIVILGTAEQFLVAKNLVQLGEPEVVDELRTVDQRVGVEVGGDPLL